ncbi:MAG: type II toxin-antitoxin system VapC family toxin [Pseudonocardiaceae bacterium]
MIYLDSSALMKLIRMENETAALREWLGERSEQPVVSSELGRVEVLRAARRVGGRALTEARAVVADIDLVPLDRTVHDLASDIGDPLLRTLDALHLASAVLLSDELTVFVAYDQRLTSAAQAAGLVVATPGAAPTLS